MGTSKRYYPPSLPPWKTLKASLSKLANSHDIAVLPEIVSKFVRLVLDDDSPIGSRNVRTIVGAVASIGGFVQSLHDEENERMRVWRQLGIEPGMSLYEIDRKLVDALLPVADARADVAAREALLMLLHELLDSSNVEEALQLLEERLKAESIEAILRRYVAYFVYELFLGDFSDILLDQHPPEIVAATCREAKKYILAKVGQMPENRTLEYIDWNAGEERTAANSLVKEVWFVLEGESLP